MAINEIFHLNGRQTLKQKKAKHAGKNTFHILEEVQNGNHCHHENIKKENDNKITQYNKEEDIEKMDRHLFRGIHKLGFIFASNENYILDINTSGLPFSIPFEIFDYNDHQTTGRDYNCKSQLIKISDIRIIYHIFSNKLDQKEDIHFCEYKI